jgi:protein KRI1
LILIVGNNDMRFDNIDFDTAFDPNVHDRKMKELFNDEYYAAGEEEIQKPEFPEIDEELEIEPTWDNYDPTADQIDTKAALCEEPHCEDTDFNVLIVYY